MAASLPLAAFSALAILAAIVLTSTAQGSDTPRFLTAPGFLGSLAATSLGAALILRAAPIAGWARVVLGPVLAATALIMLVVALNLFAR